MSPIQLFIITLTLLLILYILGNRNKSNVRAGKRLLFVMLFGLIVWATLFPEHMNDIAKKVGVGRGADLVVYALAMAFIVFALNTYLKFQDYKNKLYELSRKIALLEAEKHNGN